jgi:hypothetical protein
MMFLPGLAAGDFATTHASLLGPQGAFYLSGGDITSLTFGDLVARGAPYPALVDMETVIGLATFTIGLTYVLAAFDALGSLTTLHARVRRQAITPNRPASILKRHFRNGRAEQLADLVQALVDDLAGYDDALRRYPVVFYFHTRRSERSIPRIYSALGELIELLRWGLPAGDDMTSDPSVLALQDQYEVTGRRLLRSFVGPPPEPVQRPLPEAEFAATFRAGGEGAVGGFVVLRDEAREATGGASRDDPADHELYQQYTEWLEFHERRCTVADRLRRALCYAQDAKSALE